MVFLNFEEQAIIKMYNFETKQELTQKLEMALDKIEDIDTKEMVTNLIPKIKNYSLEDLKNIGNIFE